MWIGPWKKWNSNQQAKFFIHENADVDFEIAPMCPGGLQLIDMTKYFLNAMMYQNYHLEVICLITATW